MRKFFFNSLLVLISFALFFAIGEVISRFVVPPPMQVFEKTSAAKIQSKKNYVVNESHDGLYQYSTKGGVRLTPNADIRVLNHYLSHRDIDIRTNSLGFRSAEPSIPKGHEKRVLVLGDSITLGDYVEEKETYPSRLEYYLQKIDPLFRVFNAGIGSADIHNELQILLESGLQTKPDTVLVGLYLNDGELSANLIVRPLPGVLKKSYFANFINRRIQILAYRFRHRKEMAGAGKEWVANFTNGKELKQKDWKKSPEGFDFLIVRNARDWGAAWDPRTWEIIEKHLEEMKRLANEHGFKLYVALFPVRYQVEAEYLYDGPQQAFKKLLNKLQLPQLDLLPTLRGAWAEHPDQTLYYDKCHLTPAGNDLVAQALTQFILPNSTTQNLSRVNEN